MTSTLEQPPENTAFLEEIVDLGASLPSGNQVVLLRVAELCASENWTPENVALEASNDERFAAELTAELGRPVEPVASPAAAVAHCEVVAVAVRPTAEPVLRHEWLAPGTHVVAISAVRPEHRELDAAIWREASVLGVDDRQHVFESGDGRAALAAGVAPERAVELWELLAGRHPGRTSATQLTVFKSVGTGLQDLALARAIYERARPLGRGLDLGDWPHRR